MMVRMVLGGQYGTRMMLLAVLFVLLLVTNPLIPVRAAATLYVNNDRHFTVELPLGWTVVRGSLPGVNIQPDSTFEAPNFANDTAFFFVLSISDPEAKNTTSYVLKGASQVQDGLTRGARSVTILSEPRGLILGNRPAADFTVSMAFGAGRVTVHAVVFSSEYHELTYAIVSYARSEVAGSYQSTWDSVASSFRVTDEKAILVPTSRGSLPPFTVLIGGVVAAAMMVVALGVRRRRKKKAAATGASPPAAARGANKRSRAASQLPPKGSGE